MTLPNPGVPLSISQIVAEFPGGTNPAGLNEYYAGGPYVPAGTTGYYGPIPSSGTISIRDFYGASKGVVITVTEAGWNTGFPTFHNLFGYEAPPYIAGTFGSVSPTTLNGAGISALFYYPVSALFYCALAGIRAKSFFTSLTPSGGTTLNSASATSFTTTSTYSLWIWGGQTLTGWDGSGTSTVTFRF